MKLFARLVYILSKNYPNNGQCYATLGQLFKAGCVLFAAACTKSPYKELQRACTKSYIAPKSLLLFDVLRSFRILAFTRPIVTSSATYPCTCRARTLRVSYQWIEVAFTNAYSFTIAMTDSPACDVRATGEAIKHVFCQCDRFATQRQHLSTTLRKLYNHPLTAQTVLSHGRCQLQYEKATKGHMLV